MQIGWSYLGTEPRTTGELTPTEDWRDDQPPHSGRRPGVHVEMEVEKGALDLLSQLAPVRPDLNHLPSRVRPASVGQHTPRR
jgi:hypothetical protein